MSHRCTRFPGRRTDMAFGELDASSFICDNCNHEGSCDWGEYIEPEAGGEPVDAADSKSTGNAND